MYEKQTQLAVQCHHSYGGLRLHQYHSWKHHNITNFFRRVNELKVVRIKVNVWTFEKHYLVWVPNATLSRILKTFNNSWMQLHKILKFGSFAVPLYKIFQHLFVQMFDIIFTANQNFHNTFPIGKPYKYSVHYSPFPNL